jgi:hypothetical protein
MPLNLVFTQAGTFTIDDNGIPGDNISVIRDGNGVVIFSFAHPADALGLTVNVPGVNLIINFTDSMAAADFSIGSLTDPAITPDSIVMKSVRTTGDVTLVSNGAITEGGADAAADIVAGSLIMSAVSGVGTSGNAIETQTSFIEAETATGGINLRNTGSVQIGGLTDQVNGLDVLTSGNLNLTAIGSIRPTIPCLRLNRSMAATFQETSPLPPAALPPTSSPIPTPMQSRRRAETSR